jgi:hypothetical protein
VQDTWGRVLEHWLNGWVGESLLRSQISVQNNYWEGEGVDLLVGDEEGDAEESRVSIIRHGSGAEIRIEH